jgi:glycosyltransferase involved in cell wall biosynthesis
MNKNITAIVYALNEERRIPFVYQNLKNFCRIIVFDGGSTDGTEGFCRKNGIEFIVRPQDNSYMRHDSLKWVYANVPTEYVLHVFCAHFYPQELLSCFSQIADENKLDAAYNDLLVYRYGEIVHRPLFRRISSVCNFYKKSIVDFKDSIIHDELAIKFDPKRMVRLPGNDELSLHLFQDEDCESFSRKTINYEVAEAKQRFDRGERVNFLGLFLKPFGRFIYRYIRAGSFVLGSKGLAYATMNFIYDLNLSILIWERGKELTYADAIRKNQNKKSELLMKNKFDSNQN